MDKSKNSEGLQPDALGQLTHVLIRSQINDDLDPFLVHGHPNWNRSGDHVRACFYYAAVIGEEFTVLLDNQGRGGMCEMVLGEIAAVWDTRTLFAALNLDQAAVERDEVAVPMALVAQVPPPLLDVETLYEIMADRAPEAPASQVITLFEKIRQHKAEPDQVVAELPSTEQVPKFFDGQQVSRVPLRRLRH